MGAPRNLASITRRAARGWQTLGVGLYGQEPEVELLAAFASRLECRVVIDVGAERGSFAEQLLRTDGEKVFAIDPEPDNARSLRERFRNDERVAILEYALSDADDELQLHKSVDPSGAPLTFGHTVLVRPNTDEIGWGETVNVASRSIDSLIASGELPRRAGILKIDTEGHDLSVVRGMGALDVDVVMVEHWLNLPRSLGPCPWTADEMISAIGQEFPHFAFIVHRGEFVLLQWDDATIPEGAMGNLVFLRNRVLEPLLPLVLELASSLAQRAVGTGEMYAHAAAERLDLINELSRIADERQARIDHLSSAH